MRSWFGILIFILVAACAAEPRRSASGRSAEKPLLCVQVWPEARYRNYAYDHIVHLGNSCDAAVVCDVATNVNPTPIRVQLAAAERREVLTFRGSPSREFVPRVRCRLER